MKDRVTKTEEVLKVFPNLKRLEFVQSAKTDLHTYLATHGETPLEHVSIAKFRRKMHINDLRVYFHFCTDQKV